MIRALSALSLSTLCLLLLVSTGGEALAAAGALEISHVCAVQTGCFSGDSPGYPVTVDGAAGSAFVLTSELVVPDANTIGISIESSEITIDMNGFRIVRSGCENMTTSCTPASGTGHGIAVDDYLNRRGTQLMNGSVVGVGGYGVFLGPNSQVSSLQVRWNAQIGVYAHDYSAVRHVRAIENGSQGISIGASSSVVESVAIGNVYAGIFTATGCEVERNAAFDNGQYGIRSAIGSVIRHNAVSDSDSMGGVLAPSSVVSGNAVSRTAGGPGISASQGSLVESNVVYDTTGVGLSLGSDTGYRENALDANVSGDVTGGINLGANGCGAAICP